jgi:hypothetical protein
VRKQNEQSSSSSDEHPSDPRPLAGRQFTFGYMRLQIFHKDFKGLGSAQLELLYWCQ